MHFFFPIGVLFSWVTPHGIAVGFILLFEAFMSREPLFKISDAGLFCPRGAFYVDPWAPVATAVITHAHADHAVKGSRRYITAEPGRWVLWSRMGQHAKIETLAFGETININGVTVSLHPAGHILGSAQVRAEYQGEVWVISGDYKVAPDVTCAGFEPIRCHTFVTESTFAQSVFRWEPQAATFAQIHDWWRANQRANQASFVYAYALGKAQRLLAGIDQSIGPVFAHRDIEAMNVLYRKSGVNLPDARIPNAGMTTDEWGQSLVLQTPSARWTQGFPHLGQFSTAFASGWMVLPDGAHARRVHQGFALSDHADHHELLGAIAATGAERVFVTHGYIDEFVVELKSLGYDAVPMKTPRCRRPPKISELTTPA
jgi:putative mRNA 3-end processing factor